MSSQDYKQRLIRFYEHYAADKLDSVDDLLNKSKGKEEKLFAKLVEKYGPEPVAATVSTSNVSPGKKKEAAPATTAATTSSAKKSPQKKKNDPEDEEEEEEEREEDGNGNGDIKSSQPKIESAPVEDDYGTRPWWKARLLRFYAKYAPEKSSQDIDALLDKAKDNPVQLTKLFNMLEQKYGPEPDPSSSEEEEEEEEAQQAQEEEDDDEEEKMVEIPGLRTVVYCPVDGVPPEYSEYFETFPQALPWLAAHYPQLKLNTKKDQTVADHAKELGVEPLDEDAKVGKSDKAQARKRGGAAKKGDGKIIIESMERRRKALTTIKGLESFEGIKLKDAAKLLGKKFASGCSVKAGNGGEEIIEIQGDFSYELPGVLMEFFPSINKSSIYTVDEDGKKQPAFN